MNPTLAVLVVATGFVLIGFVVGFEFAIHFDQAPGHAAYRDGYEAGYDNGLNRTEEEAEDLAGDMYAAVPPFKPCNVGPATLTTTCSSGARLEASSPYGRLQSGGCRRRRRGSVSGSLPAPKTYFHTGALPPIGDGPRLLPPRSGGHVAHHHPRRSAPKAAPGPHGPARGSPADRGAPTSESA